MQRVRDSLRSEGFSVWTDENIKPGTAIWNREIEIALKNAGCMVVILTPNAVTAKGLLDEINYANIHEIRIFPLLADGTPKTSLTYSLSSIQWVDIRAENYSQGMIQIINEVSLQLNVESLSQQRDRLTREDEQRQREILLSERLKAETEEQERQRQTEEQMRLLAEQERYKQKLEVDVPHEEKITLRDWNNSIEGGGEKQPSFLPKNAKDAQATNIPKRVLRPRWIIIITVIILSGSSITLIIIDNISQRFKNLSNISNSATPLDSTSQATNILTVTPLSSNQPLQSTVDLTATSILLTPTSQPTIEDKPTEFSSTPIVKPTVALIVTLSGIVTAIPSVSIGFTPTNAENRVFGLTISGGVTSGDVTGGGFSLLNDTTRFDRNPVDPNLYTTTDSSGNLYLTGVNGAGAYQPDMLPFSQFVALSFDDNNAFVPFIKWSPDGRFVAFIVAGKKTANDGVWFFQPGQFPPVQLLVDCLPINSLGCTLVSNPYDPDKWESKSLLWSPNSDAILAELNLPQEGRSGFVIVSAVNDVNYRNIRPSVFRYDYGSWSRDGNYILVSGRGPDSHEYVAWLNRDGSFNKLMIDSEASGLWMGFANQANDGSIYALGAAGDRNGPREALHIYNVSGQAITGAIGEGFPDRVEWSPNGHAVFVQTSGRQYIANIGGDVRNISGQVAGAKAINWVNGELPQGNDSGDNASSSVGQLPQGIVVGSEYAPGTQLRVYVQELNIRTAPGTNNNVARSLPLVTGDYLVILAGPVDTDGARWWQVQTADGIIGWVSGAINGSSTLGP